MTDVPVFHKTIKQQSQDLDSITDSQVIPYGVVHIPEAKKAPPPWLARGWHFKHFCLNTFAKFHKSFIPGRLYCLLRNRMRNSRIFFFFLTFIVLLLHLHRTKNESFAAEEGTVPEEWESGSDTDSDHILDLTSSSNPYLDALHFNSLFFFF